MLSVAKLSRGREAYYLSTVAAGRESPGGLIEPDGRWAGSGAKVLGLSGTVEAAELRRILAGADPTTGEVLSAHHDVVRVVAYDCTYSTPKSVSLLHALGPEEVQAEVRAGHEQAADAALGYLERNGNRVRRSLTRGAPPVAVPAKGFVAAAFLHRTSRAPDPHLHSHVLVANLAQGPDGRWSALDGRGLYLELATARDLYETQLRSELTGRLGVSWRELQGAWADIAGIDPKLNRAFSRRSTEIEAALERSGRSSARARSIAAVTTRPEKDLDTAYERLVADWRERSLRLGTSEGRLASVARGARQITAPSTDRPDPGASWAERALGETGVLARDGTCRRGDLIRSRCTSLPFGAEVGEIEADVEALLSRGRLVPVPDLMGAAGRSLQAGHGRSIPGGVHETLFTSPGVLELHKSLEDLVGAYPGAVEILAYRPGERLAALDKIAELSSDPLRPVVALAPGRRAAASFEAVTGIDTVPVAHMRASRAGISAKLPESAVVVLAEAQRLGPWELASAMRPSLEGGGRVVLFAPAAALEARFGAAAVLAPRLSCFVPGVMSPSPPARVGEAERYSFGGRDVLAVGGAAEAREVMLKTWREGISAGLRPTIVASDDAVVAALRDSVRESGGSPDVVVEARQLADALARRRPGVDPRPRIAILGPIPTRVRAEVSSDTVQVVIVARHRSNSERRGRAAELARPGYLLAELGPVPFAPAQRAAWREGASAIEAFRQRWSIKDLEHAFGSPKPLRSLDTKGVGDMAETKLNVRRALRSLERAPGLSREIVTGRGPGR
jgi:conjugative relaxase-like TrwC/TraI family protein